MKIIGLCGPSCSGKSSIARELAKKLDCNIISNDHFYKLGSPKRYVEHEGQQIRTFERPEHYDGESVAKIIKELKENKIAISKRLTCETSKEIIEEEIKEKPYLIVEGFHILNYDELQKEIETSFFIDLEFEEIKKRRLQRNDRGEKDLDFLKIGKKEWEEYGQPQIKKAHYILNGKKSIQELTEEIMNKLQ